VATSIEELELARALERDSVVVFERGLGCIGDPELSGELFISGLVVALASIAFLTCNGVAGRGLLDCTVGERGPSDSLLLSDVIAILVFNCEGGVDSIASGESDVAIEDEGDGEDGDEDEGGFDPEAGDGNGEGEEAGDDDDLEGVGGNERVGLCFGTD